MKKCHGKVYFKSIERTFPQALKHHERMTLNKLTPAERRIADVFFIYGKIAANVLRMDENCKKIEKSKKGK